MPIGDLAERTGLSLRTICHYDDVGLLPATAGTDGGFRVYSDDDFGRLMVVKQMRPLGFSLEEMTEILGILASSEATAARNKRPPDFRSSWGRRSISGPRWPESGTGGRVHPTAQHTSLTGLCR